MKIHNEVEVSPRGDTVWVNSGDDGSCIGRFSKRFGIDVHRTGTEQMAGKGECIHCTHAPAGQADWEVFCDMMLRHHATFIPRNLIRFEE